MLKRPQIPQRLPGKVLVIVFSLSFFLYNCIYLVIYFLAVLCLRTLFLPGFEPGTFCM